MPTLTYLQIPQLVRKGQLWRLLTATFLREDALGIVIGSWALYQVGGYVEADCGSDRLRDAYIGSAVAGNLLECLFGGFSAGGSGELTIHTCCTLL